MTLVFDTSALSLLLSGNDTAIRTFSNQSYDQILIPLATDAEMRYGFCYGSKKVANLANYELFKQQFNLEIIEPNQDTAIIYADLAVWARKHGISLSNNDIWIAAACVQAAGVLATTDNDFEHLPQIRTLYL